PSADLGVAGVNIWCYAGQNIPHSSKIGGGLSPPYAAAARRAGQESVTAHVNVEHPRGRVGYRVPPHDEPGTGRVQRVDARPTAVRVGRRLLWRVAEAEVALPERVATGDEALAGAVADVLRAAHHPERPGEARVDVRDGDLEDRAGRAVADPA